MMHRQRNGDVQQGPQQVNHEHPVLTPVICCILATEAGERFSYFGFRAILVLYFREVGYTEETAIALFAYVTCLAYLSPVLGALLADGKWGRYNTILRFGVLYLVGLSILSASALGNHPLPTQRIMAFVGLFFVCIGTGSWNCLRRVTIAVEILLIFILIQEGLSHAYQRSGLIKFLCGTEGWTTRILSRQNHKRSRSTTRW